MALSRRVLRRLRSLGDRRTPFEIKRDALVRELDDLAAGDAPLLAGPWRGDLGYELLFWLPLLRSFVGARPELEARIVALSRGGTASWYGGIARRYVDLFELMSYQEMQALAGSEGATKKGHGVLGKKQVVASPLDRELERLAAERLGLERTRTIEPRLAPAAMQLAKLEFEAATDRFLRFSPIEPPALPSGLDLPDRYVAVRFYANPQLPRSSENMERVRRAVELLAADFPVVLLGTGTKLGGHSEHLDSWPDGVVTVERGMEPATNLATQTAVIARAALFVGTYGGLSYLAPFVGVPALGLYSVRAKINPLYLRMIEHGAREVGRDYATLDVGALEPDDVAARVRVHASTAALTYR